MERDNGEGEREMEMLWQLDEREEEEQGGKGERGRREGKKRRKEGGESVRRGKLGREER